MEHTDGCGAPVAAPLGSRGSSAGRDAFALAAAVVLVMNSSLPISTAKSVRMHGQKKQCVWRWSIFLPLLHQRAPCR